MSATKTLNEFLHYRSLAFKLENRHTMGRVMDQVESALPGKQVCTTLSHEATDRLENLLSLLSMSKRQFIELAVLSAMEEAESVLDSYDALEGHSHE